MYICLNSKYIYICVELSDLHWDANSFDLNHYKLRPLVTLLRFYVNNSDYVNLIVIIHVAVNSVANLHVCLVYL